MVTGVYHPETSGASLQCRQLIASLKPEVDFEVLTTSADASLPARDVVDGVPVTRVFVDPTRAASKLRASAAMTAAFLAMSARVDVVHLHGFSQKTILLIGLAKLFGKRTVIKLTSLGHDDAGTMMRRGGAAALSYRRVDRAIAVAPGLAASWRDARLDPDRVVLIPNAVDARRFHPATDAERAALKRELGWDQTLPAVLFVGFFSHEKRPDLLYRAWARLWEEGIRSTLVLVGATRSAYFEIDSAMAESVRADAAQRGLTSHLVFVERTSEIERYYRAADVFALPTTREGLPNVLLEAMASGLPPIITRLPGVTDWIVEDGVTGRLVGAVAEGEFEAALRQLLVTPAMRRLMGSAARLHVEREFTMQQTAAATMNVYMQLLKDSR